MKVKCPECNGYGKVRRERYNTIATKNCPLCRGDGMVEDLSNMVDFGDKLPNREDFEKWCGDTSWTPYQKSIMFLAWQEQQKKIDELQQRLDRIIEENR